MRLFTKFILFISAVAFLNFSCTTDKEDLIDKLSQISSTSKRVYFKTQFETNDQLMVSVNSMISNQKGLIVDSIFGESEDSLVNSLAVFGMEGQYSFDLESSTFDQSKSASLLKQMIGPIYADQNAWQNYVRYIPRPNHNQIENSFTLFSELNPTEEIIIKYTDENRISAIELTRSYKTICSWKFDYLTEDSYEKLRKENPKMRSSQFL